MRFDLVKPYQLMRIAERIGMYDHTRLHMDAPVAEGVEEFVAITESGFDEKRVAERATEAKASITGGGFSSEA